jgi:hypothetical protein
MLLLILLIQSDNNGKTIPLWGDLKLQSTALMTSENYVIFLRPSLGSGGLCVSFTVYPSIGYQERGRLSIYKVNGRLSPEGADPPFPLPVYGDDRSNPGGD